MYNTGISLSIVLLMNFKIVILLAFFVHGGNHEVIRNYIHTLMNMQSFKKCTCNLLKIILMKLKYSAQNNVTYSIKIKSIMNLIYNFCLAKICLVLDCQVEILPERGLLQIIQGFVFICYQCSAYCD